MFANQITLTYILLISYVTSFQKAEENRNQLISAQNIELDSGRKVHLKIQFPNTSTNIYGGNTSNCLNSAGTFDVESSELIEDDVLTDVLSKEEIQELRGLVSSIRELSVYDGVYHAFEYGNSGPHRRRKRAANALVQNLNNVVKNMEKMVESKVDKQKKAYFNEAASNLDSYIKGVENSAKAGKNSTIQIMKLDNILIVQCAEWLWYPVSKLNKTITCSEGVMRFENREQTLARACNLYNCIDLTL